MNTPKNKLLEVLVTASLALSLLSGGISYKDADRDIKLWLDNSVKQTMIEK